VTQIAGYSETKLREERDPAPDRPTCLRALRTDRRGDQNRRGGNEVSVVFMRDGVTFSFCLPTALLDSLGVSTAHKETRSDPFASLRLPSYHGTSTTPRRPVLWNAYAGV